MNIEQEIAINQERHSTVRHTTALLVMGEYDRARATLRHGFERQIRLAGLERAVREAEAEGVHDADEG